MAPIPDYCAPLIGYRQWNLTGTAWHPRLGSSYRTDWEPYVALRAVCHCAEKLTLSASYWGGRPGPFALQPTTCAEGAPGGRAAGSGYPGYHPCGIYAVNALDLMLEMLRDELASRGSRDPYIVGRVRLWGRVYPHERGYRAEYAYPDAILAAVSPNPSDLPWDHDLAQRLADDYGVPYEPLFQETSANEYWNREASRLRRADDRARPYQGPGSPGTCQCAQCCFAREVDRRVAQNPGPGVIDPGYWYKSRLS